MSRFGCLSAILIFSSVASAFAPDDGKYLIQARSFLHWISQPQSRHMFCDFPFDPRSNYHADYFFFLADQILGLDPKWLHDPYANSASARARANCLAKSMLAITTISPDEARNNVLGPTRLWEPEIALQLSADALQKFCKDASANSSFPEAAAVRASGARVHQMTRSYVLVRFGTAEQAKAGYRTLMKRLGVEIRRIEQLTSGHSSR